MKLWKWISKCPLLFLLLAGWAGLAAYTWSEGKLPDTLEKDIIQNPVFTALLDTDGKLPDSTLADIDGQQAFGDLDGEQTLADIDGRQTLTDTDGEQTLVDEAMSPSAVNGSAKTDGKADGTDAAANADGKSGSNSADGKSDSGNTDGKSGSDSADGKSGTEGKSGTGTDGEADNKDTAADTEEEAGVTRFKKYKKKNTDSPYYSDPGKKALTTDYSYQKVDKSYFDDAVFIGDSRTVGMQDYSGLDNAAFFAKTGLNVYELLEDKFITDPSTGRQASVAHMMKNYTYGKIYLMIGINELGTGNTGTFQKAYDRVIRKFRKWQPDAVIYIQGIIPVSKAKAKDDPIFNNININDKNVAIAQLADGRNVFYLDVSSKLTDKNGCLKADYTFDEVHMYAQYYELWTNYLMKHAVVRE